MDGTAQLAAAVRAGDFDPAPPQDPRREGVVQLPVAEARDVRPGPVRNLGADPTPFVGRAFELAELHARVTDHRLVTVRGPGGAGKSRLVRQLARERAGHHEDGAVWAPLGDARSPAEAVAAIARAVGVRIDPDPATLAAALSGRDQLVVLDQGEHLPDLSAVVMELLDAGPGLRVVVASRSPLEAPGEVVVAVDGLAVPPHDDAEDAEDAEAYDAVGLLLRAARRVRPDFHPVGAERVAAVALTRRLGGVPLAIELAAGWLRLLEPSEVRDEVLRDLDVVRAAHADLPARHASLRAAFESSWHLLGDGEREALRRLATFDGGCTRASAAAVADVPLAALLALTNRSLVRREDGARFGLHRMVQRFAEEKLAERGELAEAVHARHTAYFLAWARDADGRLDTPDQRAALAEFDAESANLHRVLERALAAGDAATAHTATAALGRYWRWRGFLAEGVAWIARARAIGGAEPTPARARMRLAEGLLLERQSCYPEAEAAFADGLEAAEALGDPVLVASAQLDRATVAWRRGDLTTARTLLEAARDGYRTAGRDAALAGTLGNLGNVARDAGDLDAAHARYDEALAVAERLEHVWEIANVRNNKAIAHAYAGDLDAARAAFERALELQRSIDNRPGMSASLTNLGNVHLVARDLERAGALYAEAFEHAEALADRDGMAHLHVNLGIVAQWTGVFEEAHDRYARALRLRLEIGARALATQSLSCFVDLED